MNQLATQQEPPANVQDISGGLLEVIARAARDPNVDIDKMERLLEMQERVHARGAKAAYYAALAEMQPELPVIEENGTISTDGGKTVRSTYALWEDVNEAIRPILHNYGFALTFKVRRTDNEVITTGILSHRDGHAEETELSLPSDTGAGKNAVQAVGSSSQYGKRYTAFALLNITSRGEDDDGQKAGRGLSVDDTQLTVLQGLASAVGADLVRFCRYFKIGSLKELPAERYNDAVRQMTAKNPTEAERFLTGGH